MSWSETKLLMDGHDEILEKMVTGVEPSFRSPVRFMYASSNGANVTGTGKGLLKITFNVNVNNTVVVDGVVIINNARVSPSISPVEFEFTESFSVNAPEGYPASVNAVFY